MRTPGRDEIRKVFFILTQGGLGDLLLSSPIAEAMSKYYAGCRVICWANPKNKPILDGNPYIHEFLDIPPDLSFREKVRLVRLHEFDVAILPWTTSRQTWLVYFARIPYRVGQSGRLTHSWTFTHPVKVRNRAGDTHSHWVDCQLDYARVLGCDAGDARPRVWLTEDEIVRAREFMRGHGVETGDRVCCMQIIRGLPTVDGKLPIEKFVAIGNRLMKELGLNLFLIGGSAESGLVAEVASQVPGSISIAGKTDLRLLAALIGESDVVVSPDSGPAHIAAALGTPVVSIFALKNGYPDRWRPYSDCSRIVKVDNSACTRSVCLPDQCDYLVCMQGINEVEVVEAVADLLQSPKQGTG